MMSKTSVIGKRLMLVGYARTSTVEQKAGLEAQERELAEAGVTKVFKEQTSSVGARKALEDVMEFVREGDALVVTKLDRLARSVADLGSIISRLDAKHVSLRILSMGGGALDTGTPTGRLTVNMLGAVAQFEREVMLERQREGIAKAKADHKYKGRKPTAMAKQAEIKALAASGVTKEAIAAQLEIGVASVYRALRNAVG